MCNSFKFEATSSGHRLICWVGGATSICHEPSASQCSSAVAATCDALCITSLVARKVLAVSFSLVRKCAGKPLLHWWRCGARRGREFETASCAKAYGPRTSESTRSAATAWEKGEWCSSAVVATCDALSITSLVARKLLGASFSLVRRQAASSTGPYCVNQSLSHTYIYEV